MLKELFVLENIHLKHDNILKDIGFGSDQNQDSDPYLRLCTFWLNGWSVTISQEANKLSILVAMTLTATNC